MWVTLVKRRGGPKQELMCWISLSPLNLFKGGSDPHGIKNDVCLRSAYLPASTCRLIWTKQNARCSLIWKPEIHLKLFFQDMRAFWVKLSVYKHFPGLITLWNHGIKIITFEMQGGSCALHQKFLLVLINLAYKCHGLHPQGVCIEFLAVTVSLTLQNKCHIIWLWAILLI